MPWRKLITNLKRDRRNRAGKAPARRKQRIDGSLADRAPGRTCPRHRRRPHHLQATEGHQASKHLDRTNMHKTSRRITAWIWEQRSQDLVRQHCVAAVSRLQLPPKQRQLISCQPKPRQHRPRIRPPKCGRRQQRRQSLLTHRKLNPCCPRDRNAQPPSEAPLSPRLTNKPRQSTTNHPAISGVATRDRM